MATQCRACSHPLTAIRTHPPNATGNSSLPRLRLWLRTTAPWAGAPGVFTPGTPDFPTLGPQTYGNLLIAPYIISIDETGKLTRWQYTDQGTEKMGAVRVVCTAQRQSVPIVLPVAELPLPGTPMFCAGKKGGTVSMCVLITISGLPGWRKTSNGRARRA